MTIHFDHTAAILAFLDDARGWHTAEAICSAVAPGANAGMIAVQCRALAAEHRCRREFNAQEGIAQYRANTGKTYR